MPGTWNGSVRLLYVLPMTPAMLAEYVPADFDTRQRRTSEEALAIVARESGIEPSRISIAVRHGGCQMLGAGGAALVFSPAGRATYAARWQCLC
jgi:hypothetical protein